MLEDIIPAGWEVEEIEPGKVGVWGADGETFGIWDKATIREHFASLFV